MSRQAWGDEVDDSDNDLIMDAMWGDRPHDWGTDEQHEQTEPTRDDGKTEPCQDSSGEAIHLGTGAVAEPAGDEGKTEPRQDSDSETDQHLGTGAAAEPTRDDSKHEPCQAEYRDEQGENGSSGDSQLEQAELVMVMLLEMLHARSPPGR